MGFFFPLGDISNLIIKACWLSATFRTVLLKEPGQWHIRFKDFHSTMYIYMWIRKRKKEKAYLLTQYETKNKILQHMIFWVDLNIALFKSIFSVILLILACSTASILKTSLSSWHNQYKIKMDSLINNIPHPHHANQSTRTTRKVPNTP